MGWGRAGGEGGEMVAGTQRMAMETEVTRWSQGLLEVEATDLRDGWYSLGKKGVEVQVQVSGLSTSERGVFFSTGGGVQCSLCWVWGTRDTHLME